MPRLPSRTTSAHHRHSRCRNRQVHCAPHLSPYCATLAEMKFDAGKSSAVVRDQAGKHDACKRNHARNSDLPARMSGHLPHVFGADPQVVEQPLRKGCEFLSGVRDRDLAGAAGKQRRAQWIAISLIIRVRPAAIFSASSPQRQNSDTWPARERPGAVANSGRGRHDGTSALAINAITGIISVIGNKLQ